MGIFDRFRHKAQETVNPSERAALAHDEAADAYSNDIERSRDTAEQKEQTEADRRAAENMTAEGDPWD
ncbi:hypothetical protein [Streptomyces sp. NRRL WC-3742]|uniref:hypothetical protein n=1 Tax=Streptomyces sp. NRRL WC-3742 TaxID=1463934 RepID=UPI0004CAFA1C|nr:hypothetical protein [Streptomyces sp. NRRL WC-3742]